jgi:hypothetical protein
MISTFHNREVSKRNIRGVDTVIPKCVWDYEYNVAVGGMDLKDQKLLPYLL